jgi:putative restriction endonuclease
VVSQTWDTALVESKVELELRQAIFEHLTEMLVDTDYVTRKQLWDFTIDGVAHRLVDWSRGIRNPADFNGTLSIMTSPDGPYADEELSDTLFAYAYRKGSDEGDNTKLRAAYTLKLPIILLRKIRNAVFVPVFPVSVVDDDKEHRRFLIALDEKIASVANPRHLQPLEREYAERVTKQRLHQPVFRARVLMAYEYQCAVCNLSYSRLLDAAHIIADGTPTGTPTVDNGLSLCKLHHAAYDANYLGVSPDRRVHIRSDLRKAEGGPMLLHGLQEMHGRELWAPSKAAQRPSPERLAVRYDEFKNAS